MSGGNQIEKLQIADDTKKYILQKLNPVLEDMVTSIVTDMPQDPAKFMYEWLAKKSGKPIDLSKDAVSENQQLKKQLQELKSTSAQITLVQAKVLDAHDVVPKNDEEDAESEDNEENELQEQRANDKSRGTTRQAVSAEAYGQWNKKAAFTPPSYPKTDEQKNRDDSSWGGSILFGVRESLLKSFLFSSVDGKDMDQVIGAMQEVRLSGKTRVINQGDNGDFLFVVESGELKCFKKFPDKPEEVLVKTCVSGDVFGELSLLYNVPRAASVESGADCVLWKLDRETFNQIDAASRKRERYENFLRSVSLLANIGAYEQSQIADALKPKDFAAGEMIIKQGDTGDVFFIIEEGTAEAVKDGKKVMDYKSGDYFGELALLRNEPRAASVRTTSACKVLQLDRRSFKRLLGSLEELLKKTAAQYK